MEVLTEMVATLRGLCGQLGQKMQHAAGALLFATACYWICAR